MIRQSAGFKIALVLCCAVALGGCPKKPPEVEPTSTPSTTPGSGGMGPGTVGDWQTNVGDTVYYNVDQSKLTPEAQETLRKQATWMKQYAQVVVQVEGHSDEKGTREYNIALSARRATATRNFLIAQGIPGTRISSIAFGKERPVALCDAESCFAQNRRTVTVITGGAQ